MTSGALKSTVQVQKVLQLAEHTIHNGWDALNFFLLKMRYNFSSIDPMQSSG